MSSNSTHILSLTSYKLDKSSSSAKADALSSLKQLGTSEGCKGWKFEGVAHEDPSSHLAGAIDYNKAMQRVTSETLYSRLYNMCDPLDKILSPGPECLEYVVFSLKDGLDFADFYPRWRRALEAVESSPGCCPISLGQGVNEEQRVVQIQVWMTLKDHIEGFKKCDDLPLIMGPLGFVVDDFVEGGWKGFKSYHLLLTGQEEAM